MIDYRLMPCCLRAGKPAFISLKQWAKVLLPLRSKLTAVRKDEESEDVWWLGRWMGGWVDLRQSPFHLRGPRKQGVKKAPRRRKGS